jgi:hypothetical protein
MDFKNRVEVIPVFIFSLMLLVSFINQDFVKGIVWLLFTIVGLGSIAFAISKLNPTSINPGWQEVAIFPLFASFYNTCSLSSFLIVYTFLYLLLPMIHAKNINYSVVSLFIFFYIADILGRRYIKLKEVPNVDIIGTFTGTIVGGMYGLACYSIISVAGDKLTYFSMSSSNNEYCSRPKKQQFKCNVYKNGQIISTL